MDETRKADSGEVANDVTSECNVTRRQFLSGSAKLLATGVLGASLLTSKALGEEATSRPTSGPTSQPAKPKVRMRELGRTGLNVSTISLGTVHAQASVLVSAFKAGINFVHTSPDYSGGKSIRELGKALKQYRDRDKIIVGLKVVWRAGDEEPLNEALKILGRKYVDVLFYHVHGGGKSAVDNATMRDYAEAMKKKGKVRFVGLTSHGAMHEMMQYAIDAGWYDCLMPGYSLRDRKQYQDIFKQCTEKKIGFVAMKTRVSAGDPAAIRAMLADEAMTTICRTIGSYREINAYIDAVNGDISKAQAQAIYESAALAGVGRCHMCAECTGHCPNGVAVNDVVRSVDHYVDAIHDVEYGRMAYGEIPASANASACQACGECEGHCPHGVPIRSFVRRAKQIYS